MRYQAAEQRSTTRYALRRDDKVGFERFHFQECRLTQKLQIPRLRSG